ncbi:MAG: FeoA family protein [Spirochaetota bacterium]
MNHLNLIKEKPLTDIKPGTKVKVLKLLGGERFKDKLLCMGILPGHEVEILSSQRKGPVVVKVNDTRVVIGYSMADRIIVQ